MSNKLLRAVVPVWAFVVIVMSLAAKHQKSAVPYVPFLALSTTLAIAFALLPRLLGVKAVWATLIAAVVLQVDLGRALRVDLNTPWLTAAVPQLCVPNSSGSAEKESRATEGRKPVIPIDLGEFTKLEYRGATREIQARVSQEQSLFYIKLGLVAVVLTVVFMLRSTAGRAGFSEDEATNRDADEGSSSAIQDRTAANSLAATAIFWASVLVSAIIDTRLRFNAKMMETLGCWIQSLESLAGGRHLWETYVRMPGVFFEPAMYALLPSFPSLLTILLFVGTVYFSLIMSDRPRTAVRHISQSCALGSIVVFNLIGASYHGEKWPWLMHCGVWALVAVVGVCSDSPWLKKASAGSDPPRRQVVGSTETSSIRK